MSSQPSVVRVAVAGNPNAGKSTLFNAITGARARVGNYPGVTVERKEASIALPSGRSARFIDLPGCYSLTARSPEEEVAHDVLVGRLGQGADVIVCVVDTTNLARGLYLAQQCLETGAAVVVALNMIDVATERGMGVRATLLAERLGCPVVETAARYRQGVDALVTAIDDLDGTSQGRNATASLCLDPGEVTVVRRVAEVLERHGRGQFKNPDGESLWLLTSNLDAAQTDVAPEVLDALQTAHHELNGDGRGTFNRRIIEARYRVIDDALDGVIDTSRQIDDLRSERIDRVLLHPVWGLAIFSLTMGVLFQAVFAWADPMIGAVEWLMAVVGDAVALAIPAGLVQSLIVNGLVAGVGNILVFLPQIALLFLGLAILEESGYMARAAFLLDNLMRRVGLHGKAFIPLMSSFACAVPGVMAARTIESSRDRLVTMLIAPFMSCSARLPVYVLVIAAVFSTAPPVLGFLSVGGLVIGAMYLLGFAAAIGTAWLLKRSVLRSPPPPLLLELPPYKPPVPREVARQVYLRSRVFVTQTGTIILALSLLLWGALTFPQQGIAPETYQTRLAEIERAPAAQRDAMLASLEREDRAARLSNSLGGRVGRLVEPLIEPLGFDWRIGIGLVASFAAREVLVSTLGQVYALDADVEADSPALRDALLADIDPATGQPRFTPLVGVSLMVFFVLAMQCLSTISTVWRESNSWRWPLAQLLYMNTLAYVGALVVYQGGIALGLG